MAKSGYNPQFNDDELEAIISTAADYDFHVAAHAHGSEGMKRAIRAGARSIEHGTYMAGEWVAEKAELLQVDDRLGTVETGKIADLIAVEGDPLEETTLLERVFFVMKEGVVYKGR